MLSDTLPAQLGHAQCAKEEAFAFHSALIPYPPLFTETILQQTLDHTVPGMVVKAGLFPVRMRGN